MRQIKSHNLDWDNYADNYSVAVQKQMEGFHRNAWRDFFRSLLDKNHQLNVLDIGTGPGFFLMILGGEGHQVTGIDFSAAMLKKAANNTAAQAVPCTLIQMDTTRLSFADESFDLIVCGNMAYSLEKPELAYKEWLRVLRPKGRLMIFDANWFHFLFDSDEKSKIDAFLEEYHARTGQIHETYEKERELFFDHVTTRPLSQVNRPDWDRHFLESLGARVTVDNTVGERVWTEREVYIHTPTPLFMVEAIKP